MNGWNGMVAGGMKVLQLILSVMGVFLLLFLLVAGSRGMLSREKVSVAMRALKGENLTTKEIVIERPPIQELQEMATEKQRREETYKKKELDLEATEAALREIQTEVQARQNQLDVQRAEWEQQRKKSSETGSLARVDERDATFQANVVLFSKMEAEEIAGLIRPWGETPEDDKKIRMYIRALKPSLGAEVVNLLRADAAFNRQDNDGKFRMNRILLEQ